MLDHGRGQPLVGHSFRGVSGVLIFGDVKIFGGATLLAAMLVKNQCYGKCHERGVVELVKKDLNEAQSRRASASLLSD